MCINNIFLDFTIHIIVKRIYFNSLIKYFFVIFSYSGIGYAIIVKLRSSPFI